MKITHPTNPKDDNSVNVEFYKVVPDATRPAKSDSPLIFPVSTTTSTKHYSPLYRQVNFSYSVSLACVIFHFLILLLVTCIMWSCLGFYWRWYGLWIFSYTFARTSEERVRH